MVHYGTDYKLTVSFIRRYGECLHWPHHTSTGWCFGPFGVHARLRATEMFKELGQ